MLMVERVMPVVVPIEDAYAMPDQEAVSFDTELMELEGDWEDATHYFSHMGIVTLNPYGVWTQFEAIGPDYVGEALCRVAEAARRTRGTPVLRREGRAEDLQTVQLHGEGFTLWLAAGLVADWVIEQDGVAFLVAAGRLCGIRTERMRWGKDWGK